MTEEQKATLKAVIRTLDTVTVSGAENMDRLLGCMRALHGVLNSDGNSNKGAS